MTAMLSPITIPGLFVTATDTEVGKTVISGAIANYFLRQGARRGAGSRLRRSVGRPYAGNPRPRRAALTDLQVVEAGAKQVEVSDLGRCVQPKQFAANFVVGDRRHDDIGACGL